MKTETAESVLRIVFMGTAELACASLAALLQEPQCKVVAVVTQPDRPKGRNLQLTPSPVKVLAQQAGLVVLQPEKARALDFLERLAALQPDAIVVAAYGQLLPRAILQLPRHGCLNVHTSLLPKYRGAAPVQWAILNGEAETGVTIMQMAEGLDTGDILTQQSTPISPADTSETLHDQLAMLGAQLLVPTLLDYVAGRITPRPQDHSQATHARKISKEDGRLDWTQPASVLCNRVRGLAPWPGAFTFQQAPDKPRLLKIWQAEAVEAATGSPGTVLSAGKDGLVVACRQCALRALVLQREGGRALGAAEFLAGHPIRPGEKLG